MPPNFPSCPWCLSLSHPHPKIHLFHQDTRTQDTNTKTHNICLCLQTHRYARSAPNFQSLFYSGIQRIQSSYKCSWISKSMESIHYIEREVACKEKVCLKWKCKVRKRCAFAQFATILQTVIDGRPAAGNSLHDIYAATIRKASKNQRCDKRTRCSK